MTGIIHTTIQQGHILYVPYQSYLLSNNGANRYFGNKQSNSCGECDNSVKVNQNRQQCYGCNEWHNAKCQRIDTKSYFDLVHNGGGKYWKCYKCSLPPFSNSFMEDLMASYQ